MLSAHSPMSRDRDRGIATHNAAGAKPAPASTTARGILARLRRTGRATPAATRTQAVARMPVGARKGGEYKSCHTSSGAGVCVPFGTTSERDAEQIKPGPAQLESRALRSDASDA